MNDDSRLLMSEELVGQVQGLDESFESSLIEKLVLFLTEDSRTKYEISGHLRFVQFSESPEIEMSFDLTRALEICRNKQELEFADMKIAHMGTLTMLEGPFCIDIVNLSNIDPDTQTCVITMKFKRRSKSVI